MKSPLVSVALPVFNAEKTVELAIHSILYQTYSHFELIIINDGSTDATLSIIKQFSDSRIRVFSDGQNKGLTIRLNQAIELSRGIYFARMDADDISFPERFERQVMFLEHNKDVDLLGTGALIFQGDGKVVSTFPVSEKHTEICRRPWLSFCLVHPSWMGRTAWFRTHRYRLPEVIRAEDQDLLLRTYETSCFANLTETLLGYRQDALTPNGTQKIIIGKWHYAKSLAREYSKKGKYLGALIAPGIQIGKIIIYFLSVRFGLERLFLRHLNLPVEASELIKWKELWGKLNR